MLIETLIHTGEDLEVPPRTRDERREFAKWLGAVLAALRLTTRQLAADSGVSEFEIEAMIHRESADTPKRARSAVHERALELLEERTPEVAIVAVDPRERVKRVLGGVDDTAAFFSPRDDLKAAVVEFIRGARGRRLSIQAWCVTCSRIAKAIGESGASTIELVVSHRSGNWPLAVRNVAAVGAVLCDTDRKNHNKTILIGDDFLLTGSMNFGHGSGMYDENVLITSQRAIVSAYRSDFEAKRNRLVRVSASGQ